MSDEHQTPQSAYHGADLALAELMAEFRERPQFADWAPPVIRPSFREGNRGIAAQKKFGLKPPVIATSANSPVSFIWREAA